MADYTRKLLGELLIEHGWLTPQQLNLALQEQKRTGEELGDILVRLGFITEAQLASGLAEQAGAPHVELKNPMIENRVVSLVPEAFARKNKVIPLSLDDGILTVVMADPVDVVTIDKLQQMSNCALEVRSASETDIMRTIGQYYTEEVIDDIIEESISEAEAVREGDEDEVVAPVIRIVDQILNKGVRLGATDIHIDPDELVVRTRFRVDGILQQGHSFPKKLQSAIITRIKIISDMNVSESRIPQDGKTRFYMGDKRTDMRVSTFPCLFGEAVVIRVLDRSKVLIGLPNLGFSAENHRLFSGLINRPYGIILVTGPTGSGKTTTLYTALTNINSLEKNIITIEDPIEYELPMIRQSQINVKAGMTFAVGLRSILRQDPDVILVGEMRDNETAAMAVRAALTGHLVFSTLHTNSASKAIPRLEDMGISPLLITSSVIAIIAQRLVRLICENCKEKTTLDMDLVKKYHLEGMLDTEGTYYYGRGCGRCNSSGYKGRRAIFEILPLTEEVCQLIIKNIDDDKIHKMAKKLGMKTMLEDGLEKVRQGQTTLTEVMRVLFG